MMRRTNPKLAWLIACCLAVLAPASFAQDDDVLDEDIPDVEATNDESADEGADEEAADEEETEEEESSDESSSSDEGKAAEASAEDVKPEDAADLETVYVIQGKPRLIGASFEFAPQFLQSVNDRFNSHTGAMLSGIYHLRENMAVQFSGGAFFWWDDPQLFFQNPSLDNFARLGGRDIDTTIELRENERLAPELVKLYRLTWMTTADLQWSPIYGKVALHDSVLGLFSLYLSVGAGFVGVENEQAPDLTGPLEFMGPVNVTTTVGGGLRFYFSDWLGVRFEVRDYVMPLALLQRQTPSAQISTFEVRNTVLAQVGVSFVLPAPWQ